MKVTVPGTLLRIYGAKLRIRSKTLSPHHFKKPGKPLKKRSRKLTII